MLGHAKVTLKKFEPNEMILKNRIIVVFGRRGSGKSTLIEDLMYHLRDRFDFALGMGETPESIENLKSHIPDPFVFEEGFSIDTFQTYTAISDALWKKGKKKTSLLIMDDANADKKLFKDNSLRKAFYNGRHYGQTILWGMHYMMDITPNLRENIDYVFVLKDNSRANKERLAKGFFSFFSPKEFSNLMDKATQDYHALVLDNTVPHPDPNKNLYFYKAQTRESRPPFQLGRQVFYNLAHYYRREQNTSAEDELLKVQIPRPGEAPPDNQITLDWNPDVDVNV